MKLYSIGENSHPYPEDQTWLAVWCESEADARAKFAEYFQRESGNALEDGFHKVSLEAFDLPQFEPAMFGVERRSEVLREIGWCEEGESSCDSCGLYPMGIKRFAVCEECNQCRYCGDGCTECGECRCKHGGCQCDPLAECDCCGEMVESVSLCIAAGGVETYACEKCRSPN